ncbi:group III truncated hemoglobin [Pelagibacterium mangrovi]|uniref:group III truncated hemoglobin n=1 Tax=Pelagibacterium mangrovi TaxID=3119828 RepID=UPI002FCB4A50
MATLTETGLREQVERFYEKVRVDDALGPIFADHVADWPSHLDRLTDFWSSIMLTSGRYKGNPYAAHLPFSARLDTALFERWLTLWSETARELFADETALRLEDKANRVANSLIAGMLFRANRTSPGSQVSPALNGKRHDPSRLGGVRT